MIVCAGKAKWVGQEVEGRLRMCIAVLDTSQWLWVVGGGVDAGQDDGLVAEQAGCFIDGSGITASVASIGLGADNKEGSGGIQEKQALEIQVGAVHDIAGAGLGYQQVEDVDIMQFTFGEVHKGGDIAAQVQ